MSRRSQDKRQRARARTQRRAEARAEKRHAAAARTSAASSPADPVRGAERFEVWGWRRWYIARLKPRMTEKAMKALDRHCVLVFQPIATRATTVLGRRTVRRTQMLLRQVFIGVDDDAHLETVRRTAGVAEIVSRPVLDPMATGNVEGIVNEPVRLDPVGLQRFVDAVTSDEIVKPYGVSIGQSVIVRQGPFASFPGIVEEIDEQRQRFKIAVSIFGRATPVELGIEQFEVVT